MKKKKVKTPTKRFIVRKYVMARSVQEALKIEKKTLPDDVWVDEKWKEENPNTLVSAIGFSAYPDYY